MHTEIRVNFSLLEKELVKIVKLTYYIQIPNIQSYDTNVDSRSLFCQRVTTFALHQVLTVNQFLFACEKFWRSSGEHRHRENSRRERVLGD